MVFEFGQQDLVASVEDVPSIGISDEIQGLGGVAGEDNLSGSPAPMNCAIRARARSYNSVACSLKANTPRCTLAYVVR